MNYTKTHTLLSVENVNLSFKEIKNGKEVEKKVLRDVNFSVRDIIRPGYTQGQVCSLVGRSGSGKSQILKILSGLKQPNSGVVKIGESQKIVEVGDMGMVSQNYLLFPWRTIRKNLSIAAKKFPINKGLSEKDIKDLVESSALQFEILEHLDKYPYQLSGGQKQRVSILQQLLNGSEFLLMDEPFSGLDSIMIDTVLDVLIRVSLSNELKTIIIISHDLDNSLAISDTVWILGNEIGLEGSTIKKEIDMLQLGLAWQKDIRDNPRFINTVKEVKSLL